MNKTIKFLSVLIVLFTISCNKTNDSAVSEYGDGMYAVIATKYGDIILKLEMEKTPITVANFVSLAEGTNEYVADKYKGKHFYDGLKFHRVLKDFMVQGGDPLGTGTGNPGYKFMDEFDDSLKHDKAGILSMANSGPSTNGSQFFITHKATPWLNGRHTVFGQVLKGQEIVDVIKKDDLIEKVTIIRKGKKAKNFNAKKIFSDGFAKMEALAKKAKEEKLALIKNILDKESKAKTYQSGLKIFFENEGNPKGKQPKKGNTVEIHYTGYLRDGTVFDSSVKKNRTFKTEIGVGRLIQGWDEGVLKLKEGQKAILYVPSYLAYGSRGAGRAILPNTDIIFEIELIKIIK